MNVKTLEASVKLLKGLKKNPLLLKLTLFLVSVLAVMDL